eukprot:1212744-Rhodomonas_salina.1
MHRISVPGYRSITVSGIDTDDLEIADDHDVVLGSGLRANVKTGLYNCTVHALGAPEPELFGGKCNLGTFYLSRVQELVVVPVLNYRKLQ